MLLVQKTFPTPIKNFLQLNQLFLNSSMCQRYTYPLHTGCSERVDTLSGKVSGKVPCIKTNKTLLGSLQCSPMSLYACFSVGLYINVS